MKKRGMSLVTLTIVVIVIMGIFGGAQFILTKTNMTQGVERTTESMELLNIQQIANMAYSTIYFDNLTQGIRRDLTADEIRERMIKNGTSVEELSRYNIVVKNGDVFVTLKEEI